MQFLSAKRRLGRSENIRNNKTVKGYEWLRLIQSNFTVAILAFMNMLIESRIIDYDNRAWNHKLC